MTAAALPLHDLHNHTVHCGHARPDATVAAMVARADAVGLACFGFSEHIVFTEHAERIATIRRELAELDLSRVGCRLLVGVEIDADPVAADGSWVAYPEALDYTILSLHRLPIYNVGHWEFQELKLSKAARRHLGEAWLDWFRLCVERPGIQILGHPLREPIALDLFSLNDDRTMARAFDILARAAERSIAFELNNGWPERLRELGEFDAYVSLVRGLKERGMKFSCGSDSHRLSQIGGREGILALAQAAGLEPTDWFDADAL